jgi:Holliday junction resolvasome RuvABC ATP-dependent DNA helicase subunit
MQKLEKIIMIQNTKSKIQLQHTSSNSISNRSRSRVANRMACEVRSLGSRVTTAAAAAATGLWLLRFDC